MIQNKDLNLLGKYEKKMQPKLSIIIPIYNVEKYLEECLNSIYKLKINKEVILVNDESSDNSYEIIKKYQKLYSLETKVINQKNKGLSGARNSGLKIAKGEYVAFIDSDDFIIPREYERFFYENKDKNLDIIIGTYKKYIEGTYSTKCWRNCQINKIGIVSGIEFLEINFKYNSLREEVWDDIYKRKFLIENNLEFKEGLLHEDTLFFIEALSKAKKVEYIDIPFYIYRQREGSIMSNFKYINQRHRVYIIKKLLELEKNNKKIKGLRRFILNLLWAIFRNTKEINIKLLFKSLRRKENYSFKEKLKIIILILISIICKNIEPIKLKED